MSSDNFVTSTKFLGSEMKWEISKPDSPKYGNSYKTFFTTVLDTLCKSLTMFRVALNAPFYSEYFYLIRSRIL